MWCRAVSVLVFTRSCSFSFLPSGESCMFKLSLQVQIIVHDASCEYHPAQCWNTIYFPSAKGSPWLKIAALLLPPTPKQSVNPTLAKRMFVAYEIEGLSPLFCLLCFPLWKDTFKLKHLDQKYRRNKVSHQWHFFDHLHVKLKLFLMIQHLTCKSNMNTVCELTNKFVAGRKEDRTKIPLVLWYR